MQKHSPRPKPVIVLEALIAGQTVNIGGVNYALSEDNKLCVISVCGLPQGKGLTVACDISEFCKMTEKLDDKDIFFFMMEKFGKKLVCSYWRISCRLVSLN